jgi:hypothetical protein
MLVCLVCLVGLVCFVGLVDLVYLVCFVCLVYFVGLVGLVDLVRGSGKGATSETSRAGGKGQAVICQLPEVTGFAGVRGVTWPQNGRRIQWPRGF